MSRQYAEPQSPWAVNDSDLDRLRRELADAERMAETARDWTWRTRYEQDADQLRKALKSAELDRTVEKKLRTRHERIAEHAGSLAVAERAVECGKYLTPVSPWATNLQAEKTSAPTPAASAPDKGVGDGGRMWLIMSYKAAGRPIPAWLAA